MSETENKKLLSNFFSLSILQIFIYALPLILIPYLLKVLGTEKFGLVMFAHAFNLYFFILIDFGFNNSATKDISIHRENTKKVREIFSSVLLIKITLILFTCLITFIIINSFDKFSKNSQLFYFSIIQSIGQGLLPIWYFQGLEKMNYVTIINVCSRVFFTILILFFVKEEKDYLLVPLLNGSGMLAGCLISYFIIFKKFRQKLMFPELDAIRTYFFSASHFFLSRASDTLYTSSNSFILGLFTNNSNVAYYSIAEKLYQASYELYQPIAKVFYPYVAKSRNIFKFRKIFLLTLLFNFFFVCFAYIIAPNLVEFLSGQMFSESIEAYRIFLVILIFVIPSSLTGFPLVGALGHQGYANYSVVVGSCLHCLILLCLALSHQVSIRTVLFSVLFAEIIVLFIRFYAIWKFDLFKINQRKNILPIN